MPISLENVHFKLPSAQPNSIVGTEWMGKLVAPLHAPLLSQEGILELADRVKYIGLLAIFALVALALRLAYASVSPKNIQQSQEKREPDVTITPTPRPPDGPPAPLAASAPLALSQPLPQDPLEPLKQTISSESQGLDQRINNVSKDILSVTPEAYRGFEEHVRYFLQKYAPLEKLGEYGTLFPTIRHNLETIRCFARIKQGIILTQPDQGNCFFEAIKNGLELLGIQDDLDHTAVRTRVVKWMRENLGSNAKLQENIRLGIEAFLNDRQESFKSARKGWIDLQREGLDVAVALAALNKEEAQFREENKNLFDPVLCYEEYFKRMGQPGFFASDAEFYAVSEMYKVCIHVEVSFGGMESQYNRSFGEIYLTSSRYLTVIHKNGKHFDLRKPITE